MVKAMLIIVILVVAWGTLVLNELLSHSISVTVDHDVTVTVEVNDG